MDLNRIYTWETPTRLVFGPGSARLAGEQMAGLGGTRTLVVTDGGVRGIGAFGSVLEGLGSAGLSYAVYDGARSNPSVECVEGGAALYASAGCDSLLGVGGGSSIDCAKAIGAVVNNPGSRLRDFDGLGKIPRPIPPLMAIPTTCGTGSEVTSIAVITDEASHWKMNINSPYLVPRVALVDARLLVGLPGPVAAATGMDALCHAIESYTVVNAHPISDCVNLQAIRLISRWLRPAVANSGLEAMANMVLASTLAGIGFTNTRLTIVHALSLPLTSHYGVAHGVANAVLLPYVMEFNLIGAPDRFAEIAEAMGVRTEGLVQMEAARSAVAVVKDLSRDVSIPQHLSAFGVTRESVPRLVEDAARSSLLGLNPRRVSREQVEEIYLRALG